MRKYFRYMYITVYYQYLKLQVVHSHTYLSLSVYWYTIKENGLKIWLQ